MIDTVLDDTAAETVTPKGERTRARILEAATRLFAERGYDGASIRDIEHAARVKRGVVTYHFGTKKEVWKAMVRHTFGPFLEDLRLKADLLRALDSETRLRFLIENFVRTSAQRPYMNRLMVQENFTESWRSDWIIKNFLKPARELNRHIGANDPLLMLFESDPHVRYTLLGACNMVFSHPCEVKALFNADVSEEVFIQRHVSIVLGMFEGFLTHYHTSKEPHDV